jgi:RNA polymerase sigma-70 factor (ECF subfamily)
MVRGLNGDRLAHEALLRAMAPVLRTYFGRRLGAASSELEDLVQESLLAVHLRRISFDRDRPFLPWAYSIARYKLIDHFRGRKRAGHVRELTEDDAGECFEADCLARIDVDRLLGELSDKQSMAIRATKIEGRSIADVAVAANLSEADVKVSVHRGLKALAARLSGS